MLKSYLTLIYRNLLKFKAYTLINLAGLSIGLACGILILLFVQLEFTHDRFHRDADRIYRVATELHMATGQVNALAYTAPPVAQGLIETYPEVEQAIRLYARPGVLRPDDTTLQDYQMDGLFFADSSVFDLFDFPLQRGNPETALDTPGSVLLTENAATRYFGDGDPMGRTFTFADSIHLTVTGILEPLPPNSHLRFDFLASFSTLSLSRNTQWGRLGLWTYVRLARGTDPIALQERLPAFAEERIWEGASDLFHFSLQPLTGIYFDSDLLAEIGPTGDRSYVYLFSIIGLFVLLVAGINFMNLATARSFRRAREVGVRKVLGAQRGQLIAQFLGESALLVALALVIAIGLVEAFLPTFSDLADRTLVVEYRQHLGLLLGVAVVVALASGTYPAFFLSGFSPVRVLKGRIEARASGLWLRKALVTVQFGISIMLLIGTGIVYSQLHYIQNKRLGFDQEQVVTLALQTDAQQRAAVLKQSLLHLPDVQAVSAASAAPGMVVGPLPYIPEDVTDGSMLVNTVTIDADYLDVMRIPLVAGRTFEAGRAADQQTFLVNEAAVRAFGWASPEDAPGKQLTADGGQRMEGTVIGVVPDYHYASLREDIQPLVLQTGTAFSTLLVRIRGDRILDTMQELEARWTAFAPEQPFMAVFLDERLQTLYDADTRFGRIFGYFAGLAVLIACLGLFGLAAFTAEQRTKEIGIRKVLGASVPRIAELLTKEYVVLMGIANLIAWPAVYVALNPWLDNFAYRMPLDVGPFLLGGVVALSVALLTVGYHAVRAALADPVASLRSE